MQFTKEGATFTQNNQNFYVGNIESDDTIMFKDDFIVIGNVKSKKNIIAAEGLIVIGNITSKSIFVYRDLLCAGKISIPSVEVEGILRELDNGSLKVNGNIEIKDIMAEKKVEESSTSISGVLAEEETNGDMNASEHKQEIVAKNNVIKERDDIKLYDKVRHRVYGTGIVTNLTTKGIYVEFYSGQVKRLDLNKVLNQGVLKKDGEYGIDKPINKRKEIEKNLINEEAKDVIFNEEKVEKNTVVKFENEKVLKSKENKRKSTECISKAKERLRKSNIVTNLEKIRVGSVIVHETLGEGIVEEFNTKRIKVNFLNGGVSSLDAKLILKLKVMKVKIF